MKLFFLCICGSQIIEMFSLNLVDMNVNSSGAVLKNTRNFSFFNSVV